MDCKVGLEANVHPLKRKTLLLSIIDNITLAPIRVKKQNRKFAERIAINENV